MPRSQQARRRRWATHEQRGSCAFHLGPDTGSRHMELSNTDVALRLGAAAAIGIAIGINRDLAQKPIGMRTLGLVALGAAILTVAAIEVPGMTENTDAMSRVVQGLIQGIMAGIGFIGAGVVLRNPQEHTVEGLTTSATVWATAALGIAAGLAAWTVVVIGLVLALILLVVVGWLEAASGVKKS